MFKLTILCVFDRFAKMKDEVYAVPDDYETTSHAELRALRWLLYRPNDIVMIEETA